jgi:hypothetical protein
LRPRRDRNAPPQCAIRGAFRAPPRRPLSTAQLPAGAGPTRRSRGAIEPARRSTCALRYSDGAIGYPSFGGRQGTPVVGMMRAQ